MQLDRREEGRVVDQIGVRGGRLEGCEQVQERGLLGFAQALEVQDLAEVGVGFVGDVDEVGLHEGFGRRGADLEGFEERVDARHGLGDAFYEAAGVSGAGGGWEGVGGDQLWDLYVFSVCGGVGGGAAGG